MENYGAEEGDILILTKPLGCGILNTAIKAEMASQEEIERVQKIMAKLNKYAAEIASKYTIHSCTDVNRIQSCRSQSGNGKKAAGKPW